MSPRRVALALALLMPSCSTTSNDDGEGARGGGGKDGGAGATGGGPSSSPSNGGAAANCIFEPEAGCDLALAPECFCLGCSDECSGATISDCLCEVCATDPFCSDPSACIRDASCDPFNEGCHCADCADHPSCANQP
jgi:hypothetical protein